MNIIHTIAKVSLRTAALVIPGPVKLFFNNLFFMFRSRCLSCNWKKKAEEMHTPDQCFKCASEPVNPHMRGRPVARKVMRVA